MLRTAHRHKGYINVAGVTIRLACCALLSISVVLLSAMAACAQEPPLTLVRLTGAVELDGLSDETAWQAVPPLPMIAR